MNRKRTVFMLTSRSCPYNCTFCFHTTGRKYRQRSLDGFFQELNHLVARYDIESICLADEPFGHNIDASASSATESALTTSAGGRSSEWTR